jgi:hypothetical protein
VEEHELLAKATGLQERMIYPPTPELMEELNQLDTEVTRGRLEAEKLCRKFRTGAVPYSQARQQAGATIDLWTLLLARKAGRRISSRKMERLAKFAGVGIEFGLSIDEMKTRLTAARQGLRAVSAQGRAHRDRELEAKAAAIADAGNLEAAQVYRDLISREKQRENARLIRAVNDSAGRRGVTSVKAVRHDGTVFEVFDKLSIEQECMLENQRRFQQACSTPTFVSPLYEQLGNLGFGPAAEHILNGSYQPPTGTDPFAVLYLMALRRDPATTLIPLRITLDDYIRGWKKADECTSSGRSGLTFSHFIADLANPTLVMLDWTLFNISMEFGAVPDRWKQGINVMLEKKTWQ